MKELQVRFLQSLLSNRYISGFQPFWLKGPLLFSTIQAIFGISAAIDKAACFETFLLTETRNIDNKLINHNHFVTLEVSWNACSSIQNSYLGGK